MNRRHFTASLAALGLAHAANAEARVQSRVQADALRLSRNGWMPNNDCLPVLHYHRAFVPASATADQMEAAFSRNQWPPQWRNGIYDFHHFHSTAHEVLGIAAGAATLILGGEDGHQLDVEAGDVLVLPTGTGHCRPSALNQAHTGLLVIGAYPKDQHWDICRSAPDAAALARMATLPFPASDPVTGPTGQLPSLWHA